MTMAKLKIKERKQLSDTKELIILEAGFDSTRKTKTIEMPELVGRKAGVAPNSFRRLDGGGAVVDIIWSTGATVRTFDWNEYKTIDEELSLEPKHIRQTRMKKGLPMMDDHAYHGGVRAQIGKVENNTFSKSGLAGQARFSKRKAVEEIIQDVEDGILENWSVGYRVYAYEVTKREGQVDHYLAVDWEPMEVSLTSMEADTGATTRSCDITSPDDNGDETRNGVENTDPEPTPEPVSAPDNEQERNDMTVKTAPAGENTDKGTPAGADVAAQVRADTSKIMTRAKALGLGIDIVEDVLSRGLSVDQATDEFIAAQKRKTESDKADEGQRTAADKTPVGSARTFVLGQEAAEKDGESLIDYLAHRGDPVRHKLSERAQKFMGFSMVDICRHVLQSHGTNPMGLPRHEVVRRAMTPFRKRDVGGLHTTSDFADLLGDGVLNRVLLAAYEATPDDYADIVTETTFSDTRVHYFIRVGGLGVLRKVEEAEEYKRVTFGATKEEVGIEKHGEIFGLTLEAMINDDLSAFTRMPAAFGSAAKLTESNMVYQLFVTNPAMSDTNQLFSVAHANIGSASAPDVTGLTDARTVMRKQTDPDSGKRLGIKPYRVIIPYKYELGLAQITAPVDPTTSSEVIPQYIRDTKYIVSDTLDEASTQIWYAVADPRRIEGLVVARLEGNRPFDIERKEGWNVDGMEWKIRHWFGVGVVDHRGLYRNPGV